MKITISSAIFPGYIRLFVKHDLEKLTHDNASSVMEFIPLVSLILLCIATYVLSVIVIVASSEKPECDAV
jgi:hypothetical protein